MGQTHARLRVTFFIAAILGSLSIAAGDPAAGFAEASAVFERAKRGEPRASERASELFQKLSEQDPANPLYLAYWGSSDTMRGRDAWAPWDKMKFARGGLDLIDRALARLTPAHDQMTVGAVPVSVETRLVAASTFLAVPDFLDRFERGKAVVAEALRSSAYARSPGPIRAQLQYQAALVARREKRDSDEAVALRDVLALQADGPIADQAQARLKELGR
jgi:hypothetical protein